VIGVKPMEYRHETTGLEPLSIPAYWTPDQAIAVVELLDGLRELIWALRSGSCWTHAAPNSSLSPTTCSSLGVRENRFIRRIDGSLPVNIM
jgi:hypothetical protein